MDCWAVGREADKARATRCLAKGQSALDRVVGVGIIRVRRSIEKGPGWVIRLPLPSGVVDRVLQLPLCEARQNPHPSTSTEVG